MEKQLYCELLEFQFISTKIESDATINIPWEKNNTLIGQTSGKSDIEQRIAQIRQEQPLQAPSPCNTLSSASKQKSTKISDICKKNFANQSLENDSIKTLTLTQIAKKLLSVTMMMILSLNNQIIREKDVQLETTRIRNRKQNK